jgi:hypothetical protein
LLLTRSGGDLLKPRKRSSVIVSGNSHEQLSPNRWTFPMFSEENPVKTNALRSRLSELRHVFAGIECDYAIAAALSFAATGNTNPGAPPAPPISLPASGLLAIISTTPSLTFSPPGTPRVAQWVWQPDTVKW